MIKFVNIDRFGEIFIDKVLFESYEPILFTCKNAANKLFIVVCCKSSSEMKKWLISEIDADCIVDLLTDKITIREAFLTLGKYKYSIIQSQTDVSITSSSDCPEDWGMDSIFLPSEGEYMDVDEGEFEEEVLYYKSLKNKCTIVNEIVFGTINLAYSECTRALKDTVDLAIDYVQIMEETAENTIALVNLLQNISKSTLKYVFQTSSTGSSSILEEKTNKQNEKTNNSYACLQHYPSDYINIKSKFTA